MLSILLALLNILALAAFLIPGLPQAGTSLAQVMQAVAALPRAEPLIDYPPGSGALGLYRLPGNVCFLRTGRQTDQTNWIRRNAEGRIEITVSAPLLMYTGRRFDPADGVARTQLGGSTVDVPATSPGAPTWRFTLDDTPALRAELDAEESGLRFTAIRDGEPVPAETLDVGTTGLAQGLAGLESCALGAELPGVVGP